MQSKQPCSEFPFLNFHKEWADYIEKELTEEEGLPLYTAIAMYGIKETEPKGLSANALKYFNETIRPLIDEQHDTLQHVASMLEDAEFNFIYNNPNYPHLKH